MIIEEIDPIRDIEHDPIPLRGSGRESAPKVPARARLDVERLCRLADDPRVIEVTAEIILEELGQC